MKKLMLIGLVAAGAAYLPVAYADDAGGDHHFVKDSVITTKVKTKLAAKHMSTLTHVKVDTDANGVVWLSGTAPTRLKSRWRSTKSNSRTARLFTRR